MEPVWPRTTSGWRCYALGNGLPFVAVRLLLGKGARAVGVPRRHKLALERLRGALLLGLGLLLVIGLWKHPLPKRRPAVAGFTPSF